MAQWPHFGDSAVLLDHDGGSVGEHLGDGRGDLVGVVAHGEDGVGAGRLSLGDEQVVGLLAGLLGEFRVQADVAAKQDLAGGADVADEAARAHGEPAHHADVAYDPVTRQCIGGSDEHLSAT